MAVGLASAARLNPSRNPVTSSKRSKRMSDSASASALLRFLDEADVKSKESVSDARPGPAGSIASDAHSMEEGDVGGGGHDGPVGGAPRSEKARLVAMSLELEVCCRDNRGRDRCMWRRVSRINRCARSRRMSLFLCSRMGVSSIRV